MVNGLESASKSLTLNEKKIGSLVNNLANLNSTGYKRELPFEQIMNSNGENTIRKNMLDFTQGDLIQTDNPLDLAINGDAFFVIAAEDGDMQFTKNGKFAVSDEGFLVDNLGNKVMGQSGEIQLLEDFWQKDRTVSISTNGEIFVGKNFIDKLKIVAVEDKAELIRCGNNNYKVSNGYFEDLEEDQFKIAQGYLENSNVNPIIEMEEMIRISKEYESAQKMIQYIDEIMARANEIGTI